MIRRRAAAAPPRRRAGSANRFALIARHLHARSQPSNRAFGLRRRCWPGQADSAHRLQRRSRRAGPCEYVMISSAAGLLRKPIRPDCAASKARTDERPRPSIIAGWHVRELDNGRARWRPGHNRAVADRHRICSRFDLPGENPAPPSQRSDWRLRRANSRLASGQSGRPPTPTQRHRSAGLAWPVYQGSGVFATRVWPGSS